MGVQFLTNNSGSGSTTGTSVPIPSISRTLLGEFSNVTNGQVNSISQTWGSLEADFDSLEVALISNENNPLRYLQSVPVKSWTDNVRVNFFSDGVTVASITNMDIASNTFQYSESANAFNNVNVCIYGVRNGASENTAVMNYQDIGNTRIQWGSQAVDGVVILPQPFADTNYSVTTANTFPSGLRTTQVISSSKTTTQFTTVAYATSGSSNTGCDWIAIGVKP